MARLEVKKLAASLEEDAEADSDVACEDLSMVEQNSTDAVEDDETLFISAIGNLDTVFRDHVESSHDGEPAPRLLKSLGKRRVVPEETLDLHGLTRSEALQRVGFFLQKASYNGLRTLLVVTGKGKGSEKEGVLRAAVADFLNDEGGKWVSAWGVAPRALGGEGALVVFLRSRPRI